MLSFLRNHRTLPVWVNVTDFFLDDVGEDDDDNAAGTEDSAFDSCRSESSSDGLSVSLLALTSAAAAAAAAPELNTADGDFSLFLESTSSTSLRTAGDPNDIILALLPYLLSRSSNIIIILKRCHPSASNIMLNVNDLLLVVLCFMLFFVGVFLLAPDVGDR